MIDPSIRTMIDQHNIAAQAAIYRGVAGGSFEVMPHWARGYSGLESPTFNIFLPLSPTGLADEALADTAAFFSSREVLYSVEIVHDRLPAAPDFLNQRRYQSLPPQPAMCLSGPPRQVQLDPEVVIEQARTVPALTAFCTLLHQVFDFPLYDMVKLFPVAQLKAAPIRHYLAFIEEQPVSAGSLICLDGVCSVWNLCTIDAYRQRGAATTLLYSMLTEALEQGCRISMLYSTAQAYHFFNKFGFEIYTQRQWFLPPDIDYEE